jgi:ArsR family transcriptional regulator
MDFEKQARYYQLLGDKNRLQIVASLKNRERCACDFIDLLQTSQPNISQHIRKLKDADVIRETKKGKWSYYALNDANPEFMLVVETIPAWPIEANQSEPCDCN